MDKCPRLWIHESSPKYTYRIDMKIGHFVAWLLSDWATNWTDKGVSYFGFLLC